MKKYLALVIIITLLSCEGKKEIELPKADKTIVADVQEHSPIYIFFKVDGKDTIADVNRKNSIVSTNWIFNIDKRLPLRVVVPELIKLQAKKDGSMHKNEAAENYFSYANDAKKTMAFLPFTKVKYHLYLPKVFRLGIIFGKKEVACFGKETLIFNYKTLTKKQLADYITQIKDCKDKEITLIFEKNYSYQKYVQYKIDLLDLIKNTDKSLSNEEYVFNKM